MFNSFFQGTFLLCFTELVATIHSLVLYLFQNSTCSHELRIYSVFDRYFFLRRTVISKQRLQPFIWVLQPSFQATSCCDIVFSRVLSLFEISTWYRLCFQRYWVNSPSVAAIHLTNGLFSNLLYFSEQKEL